MTIEKTIYEIDERPRLDAFYWGGAIIWAGLIFGADILGYLPQIGGADAWSWVFIGVGLFGLVLSLYSLSPPNYATPTTLDYIWSGFWLVLGLGGLISIEIFWPLVFISIGVIILWSAFRHSN